ncbi:MAG: nucleotidyltransferase domain-containing protein [Methyloprofundus sp.]|nr:nucleotidyltransferase domain-containing protein [Methyloprofundus sp.]
MRDKNLKKIINLAAENTELDVVWLYGSQARGTATAESDYDLAVAFKRYIDDPIERRLRPELLALQWQQILAIDLSIIDINQVPLELAYTVVQDNYFLHSNNEYRRLVEEQRIMSKWEIDYLYHRKNYA